MTQASIVWMDLEMTGLNPVKDRILEVAAIATDWQFQEIATLTAVVQVPQSLMQQRMVGPFWDKYAAVRRALMDQNQTGQPADEVQAQLIAFLRQYCATDQPVLLAGNSIHQDRKFIDHEWPEFSRALHYRMLDVSAWKVVFEGKYHKKFAKPQTHRALDDIRGSIQELQYYLKNLSC